MSKYIIRRILIFIPTLFIITLLAFIISVNAPGDPVDRMMSSAQTGEQFGKTTNTNEMQLYWRKKLGLDLPLFYVSLRSMAAPDTLYKIYDKSEKEALERLIDKYGNWKEISHYANSLVNLENALNNTSGISLSNADEMKLLEYEISSLKYEYDDDVILFKFNSIEKFNAIKDFDFNDVKKKYDAIKSSSSKWKNFIPAISFHKSNQYHRWLFGDGVYSKGILRGDFGISYVTKQPVSQVIGEKIRWSLVFCNYFRYPFLYHQHSSWSKSRIEKRFRFR